MLITATRSPLGGGNRTLRVVEIRPAAELDGDPLVVEAA
jgi:hypothetical protein